MYGYISSGERLIGVCTVVLPIPLANLGPLPRGPLTRPEGNPELAISGACRGCFREREGTLS